MTRAAEDERTHEYDVVVLGAGPVGENVVDRVRAAGLSAAVVEAELVGGECSYWACMPSKSLLRPAIVRSEARRVPGLRAHAYGPLDAHEVLAHRDSVVGDWKDDGQVDWVRSTGAQLYRGQGRLHGPRRVTVEGPEGDRHVLTARHAVAVCTGSRAVLPDLPGLAGARPWTSREATSSPRVPDRLVVVGGGVVGVEMATAWQALGSRVTLLVRGDGLLPRMEPFAGEHVAEALAERGADVRTGAVVSAVVRDGSTGPVTVVLADGDVVEGDEVLFATGRRPRTEDIGLETVGLEPGSWLAVDDSLRVEGHDWLYAVGDVNHRALLTHQGKYQARIAGAAIAARAAAGAADRADGADGAGGAAGASGAEAGGTAAGAARAGTAVGAGGAEDAKGGGAEDGAAWGPYRATADHAAVPQVVFTDPEVAAVGLSLAAAQAAGHRVRAVDLDMTSVAGAGLYAQGYRGRARMVVDRDREVVLGVTFVGSGVGELLHSATVAVAGEVPIARLWHAVPSYPTLSEAWLRLLEAYRDRAGAP
ncbi:dihydrolipoyl dehydrogenase family protein [Streptomyces roseicoloratus]|uniref:dihydrolipoyl dehydrogenase family protein n=1 Tax=Streptomyces roseicoloratus TaxID=2508722 RepID=UPI001009B7AC|nr:NAD(P)/FAD-dependent oxidoreductase [Streptomyces roseicoloratus]